MSEDASVPRLVVETTMAIFEKRKHDFMSAFGIARGTLTQNGFLKSGSEDGPPENIKLTSKGHKRDREMQRRSARRVLTFNRLYKKFEDAIDKSGPKQEKQGKTADSERE